MSSLISALQLVFLLGLILAVIGQIGRRVFASNSCWRCRFDLSGHPNVPDGPFPVVCPECGESIAEPAMLRVDKQVPRVGLRRTGLVLMLAIVPVAVVFVRAGYSFDEYRVATDRSIIRLAETDYQAMSEFQRRLGAGEFSTARLREIGQRATAIILAIPQDRIKPGSLQNITRPAAMWGDAYIALLDMGVVAKEEAGELFDAIVTLSLDFPLHNREGDPLFFQVVLHGNAVGTENLMPIGVNFELDDVSIDGEEVSRKNVSGPNQTLTRDYLSINQATTLANSWVFGVDSREFVFSFDHIGRRSVTVKGALRSDSSSDANFTRKLLDRAYGGRRQFELTGDLVIQPEGDNEASRWAPAMSEIVDQYGTFRLAEAKPFGGFFEFSLSVDDRLDIPEDSAVVVRAVVRSRPGGRILSDQKLVILSSQRSDGIALLGETEEIVQSGGVWLELHSVPPNLRDRVWRPLVITGDVDPVWIPLESPKP
jgi:hypothetical protein